MIQSDVGWELTMQSIVHLRGSSLMKTLPVLHAGSGDAEPWATGKKEMSPRQGVKDASLVSGSVELLDQVPPER